ncbi:hypothetical protein QEN19_001061 [Hanseniaspora menglaensis]
MSPQHGSQPIQHQFNPYSDNGGTLLGIAGEDFAILASDTRQSVDYSINTRLSHKIKVISPPVTKEMKLESTDIVGTKNSVLFGTNGFSADGDALTKAFEENWKWYVHDQNSNVETGFEFLNENNEEKESFMSMQSAARNVQHLLYGKRFFPYYVHTILAGLDEEGKGCVYSFDPVGSYEREQCRVGGAGASLIMPFLDNQVNFKNQYIPGTNSTERRKIEYLSLDECLKLVKDAFTSVTERHITVGDGLEIFIIDKNGVRSEYHALKKD